MHDFEGASPEVGFDVRRLPGAAGWSAVVEIPVAGLETGSARRDAKMRAMLEADRHPVLRASFEGIDPTAARPRAPGGTGTLPFTLAIRDVRRPVAGRVRHWREQADRVVFEVDFPVSLAAFDRTAPSVLGVVRVADEVRVTVQVRVAPANAASEHEGP